jgi:hypothetical protein
MVPGRWFGWCHRSGFRVGTRGAVCRSTLARLRWLGCGWVPAGDAAAEPGRFDGVLPAVGAQRTPPETGVPTARVIHGFGRVEGVDRAGLVRLVASTSRFLDPEQAVAAAAGASVGTRPTDRPSHAASRSRSSCQGPAMHPRRRVEHPPQVLAGLDRLDLGRELALQVLSPRPRVLFTRRSSCRCSCTGAHTLSVRTDRCRTINSAVVAADTT